MLLIFSVYDSVAVEKLACHLNCFIFSQQHIYKLDWHNGLKEKEECSYSVLVVSLCLHCVIVQPLPAPSPQWSLPPTVVCDGPLATFTCVR